MLRWTVSPFTQVVKLADIHETPIMAMIAKAQLDGDVDGDLKKKLSMAYAAWLPHRSATPEP